MGHSFRCRRRLSRITVVLALVTAAGAPAAVHRLSAGQSFSNVELGYFKPALSPDGKRVVYCQDAETDGAYALWSVKVVGGPPVRLSPALAAGRLACWFQISPDGSRVVYLANQNSASSYDLFSAPVDGSALAVQLNPGLVTNGGVSSDFAISPDSSTVVYRGDQAVDERFDLWSVPIGGGLNVELNANFLATADVTKFGISPTGLDVVYLIDLEDDERFIIVGSPIFGGGWWYVASPGFAESDWTAFQFISDGSQVVILGDRDLDDRFELYRSATDGSTAGTHIGIVPGLNGDVFSFTFSPDGAWVVYFGDLVTNNLFELFTVSTAGTGNSQLNGDMVDGGDVDGGFVINDSDGRLAYVADQEIDGRYDLYSVFVEDGPVVRLNPVLAGTYDVAFDPLALPASSRFAYRVNFFEGLGSTDLYSVPDTGGASAQLSPVPPNGIWTAQRPVAAAFGAHVFFELQTFPDLPGTNATTLYRAAVDGSELLSIAPVLDLAAGETFSWLGPSADPRQALFVSNDQTGFETELYAGDICALCDGFESGGTARWSTAVP